jgi:hypothetical protein
MISQGANIEAQSKRGYTALILASSGGNKTIVESLLTYVTLIYYC